VGSSVGRSGFVPENGVISLSREKEREKRRMLEFEHYRAITRYRSLAWNSARRIIRYSAVPSPGNSQGRRRAATNNVSASVISPRDIHRYTFDMHSPAPFRSTPVWRFCGFAFPPPPASSPVEMGEIIPRENSAFSRFVIPFMNFLVARLRVSRAKRRKCNRLRRHRLGYRSKRAIGDKSPSRS